MIYEYAVDPSLLSDVVNCERVFTSFRQENGRVLAEFPKKWGQAAFNAINQIPHEVCQPVHKKTLKEHLRKLLDQAIVSNRNAQPSPDEPKSWLDWITEEHARLEKYPFAGVLTLNGSEEPTKSYSISRLQFACPELWNVETQIRVKRQARDIVSNLIPLFKISKEISLIDNHLYPGDVSSLKFLRELLQHLPEFNYGRGIRKIVVHSSDHRKDLQDSLETRLAKFVSKDVVIEYRLWPEKLEHDRFAITDVGGISLGHGFDEMKPGKAEEVRLSLLSYKDWKAQRAKHSGSPTYTATICGASQDA